MNPAIPDLPADWDVEDGWLDDLGDLGGEMFPEPVLAADNAPALTRREAARLAARLTADRRVVVIRQRDAALNGAGTKGLAAALAAEAGLLYDRARLLRDHGQDLPARLRQPKKPVSERHLRRLRQAARLTGTEPMI